MIINIERKNSLRRTHSERKNGNKCANTTIELHTKTGDNFNQNIKMN